LIGRVVSILLLLLPTTIVAKLTKAEMTTIDSDDHRGMMVPSAKETTIATSSPSSSSSSSARRTSNELLSFGSTTSANKDTIDIDAKHCHPVVPVLNKDNDDDDDASHNSNIDAYYPAQDMQTKQVAPIHSIIVTFMQTIDHCITDDGGGCNNDKNRHRHDVHHHHLFDNDDWSVLTMDPTLQAISRRLAEGLIITYPQHQPHVGLSAMMVVGPGNGEDATAAAAAAADDLSEIAPLDLVSL
jgi:hypothetical protein